jgi:hypothetical protein
MFSKKQRFSALMPWIMYFASGPTLHHYRIYAIMTPSASGFASSEWMCYANKDTIEPFSLQLHVQQQQQQQQQQMGQIFTFPYT